jgi:hypothetical protein
MDLGVTVAWNVMPKVGALYTRRRTFSGAAQEAGCGRGRVVTLGRQAARKNACRRPRALHSKGCCATRGLAHHEFSTPPTPM